MFTGTAGEGTAVEIEGLATPGLIHKDGLLITGTDGKKVSDFYPFRCLNLLCFIFIINHIIVNYLLMNMWCLVKLMPVLLLFHS